MSDTAEPILSTDEYSRDDMSYLYGRDPSILSYNQRPLPSHETKRNLMSLLEDDTEDIRFISNDKTSISSDSSTNPLQTLKVYLRMKPFPLKMKLTKMQEEAYQILNPTTLLTKLPALDNNTTCLKKIKTQDTIAKKFTFTQTFGSETTQFELFEKIVQPQMVDFIAGKNAIVMTYGTTNSGKSYTLQGTAVSPGIIPRGLEYLFSNITPRTTPCYKVTNCCDIEPLAHQERIMEMDAKMKMLSLNSDKSHHVNTYRQMQKLLQEELPARPSQCLEINYSVWISFAEIYNEIIYDLLTCESQKKRPPLKLSTDNQGRTFIKGLRSICVSSGAEAYQVLMAGQENLKVAATALNSRSSRSHCIFTIKLLKYKKENSPESVRVSTFAFCDLAGSERLKKTLNVGERLKEAQNINTSLLVLGRCLKTIYETQATKNKNDTFITSIAPFRESKLTRLFQRALSGKEHIALVVNVNPVPNLYIETQNVLNFSAIAKKIVIEPVVVKTRRSLSRFSRIVTQNRTSGVDWESELQDLTEETGEYTADTLDEEDKDSEKFEELLEEIEILKKENKELKCQAFSKETQIRKEMTDLYSKLLKNMESEYKNRMNDLEEQHEDYRDSVIQQIHEFYKQQSNNRKRSRFSENDENDDIDDEEDLIEENNRLTTEIELLKKSKKKLKQNNEKLESEKNQIAFELALTKDEIKQIKELLATTHSRIVGNDINAAEHIEKLQGLIETKNERINKLKVFLDEAKAEYIAISNQNSELENEVQKQNELLALKSEHIEDLEDQLQQANAYSSQQNRVREQLEEELDGYVNKFTELEKRLSKDNYNNKEEFESKEFLIEEYQTEIESLKLRLEFTEAENLKSKEKLKEKASEILALKQNIEQTINQVDLLTEKLDNMNLETKNTQHLDLSNKEIQTENLYSDTCNTSCQTLEVETPTSTVETDEKSLQTSFNLNRSTDFIKEDLKKSIESFNELQFKYDQLKKAFEVSYEGKCQIELEFDQKMNELKNKLNSSEQYNQKLQEEIEELKKELTFFDEKKFKEKELIDTLEQKIINLENELVGAKKAEQDKEKEISTLQKEMKNAILSNEETEKKLEEGMKDALKEVKDLENQIQEGKEKLKQSEKDKAKILKQIEESVIQNEDIIHKKNLENHELKNIIRDLQKSVDEACLELEAFRKNRDETVFKYEKLFKQKQDDLEMYKKEVARLQECLQGVKENREILLSSKKTRSNTRAEKSKVKKEPSSEIDCTSEDEDKVRSMRTFFLTPSIDKIPLGEHSESEKSVKSSRSSKSVRSTNKEAPKSTRTTRTRKKLLPTSDESMFDIEPTEIVASPVPNTRNLRKKPAKKR